MLQPWFANAKLGIFLHWGVYAVDGTIESWPFFNGQIPYETYMSQLQRFTASKYDPAAWAELFSAAGARYAVLTAKHHDGVALWPTAQNELSIPAQSPAGRDLIGPYAEAMRAADIKVGIYFSHLDWSEPSYRSVFKADGSEPNYDHPGHPFNLPADRQEHPEQWDEFLRFHRAQLKELCTSYDPDLLWFDGDWERTETQWDMAQLRDQLHNWAPGVVLNSRMGGHGDYATPEQAPPVLQPSGPWEFCMTASDSWGHRPSDTNYKTVTQLVQYFCDVIGMGGNLLLAIGPKEDGTFSAEHEAQLRGLGAWIKQHDEAIYPTGAGLPFGHVHGPSTLSADRRTLYLFCPQAPTQPIAIKGLHNRITSASVLGTGVAVSHRVIGGAEWLNVPGVTWLEVPADSHNEHCTVIKLTFAEPVALYRGEGEAIEVN